MSRNHKTFVEAGVGDWDLIEEWGWCFIEWSGPGGQTQHVMQGDQVLVDARAYGGPAETWVTVKRIASGSASVYPVKVTLPHGAPAQYKPTELLGVKDQHDPSGLIEEAHRMHRESGSYGPRLRVALDRRKSSRRG